MYSNSRNQTSSNSNRVNQRNIMEMFSSGVIPLVEARRKEKEEKRKKSTCKKR